MGALQPGLPNPAMIPREWDILIVDLKDCFFTIALRPLSLTVPLNEFQQERIAHDTFHQNARGLHKQFRISLTEARGIVKSCSVCT
ncbi:POK9 protein, partial [Copsychus sechellarum]|nr:POK9 protein [Copsychus sechellarum]